METVSGHKYTGVSLDESVKLCGIGVAENGGYAHNTMLPAKLGPCCDASCLRPLFIPQANAVHPHQAKAGHAGGAPANQPRYTALVCTCGEGGGVGLRVNELEPN